MGTPFLPPVSRLRFLCILLVVLALHFGIGYVLVLNAPGKAVNPISKPLEAVLIQQRQVQAPPATQTLVHPHAPRPGVKSSPPFFVSQPDVTPQVTQSAQVIQVAPALPAAVVTAPAAPPPPVLVVTGPQQVSIGLVCPNQVAPEMPRRALKDGIEGVVRAQIHVKGKHIVDVTILSGPRIFHAAVREAMLQYNCMTDGGEVIATQDFSFKLE